MAIKEKDLPVAENLGSGDKIRIITAEGNSKNIDASQIGGDIFKITLSTNDDQMYMDKTYNEIISAINSGLIPIAVGAGQAATQIFMVNTIYQNPSTNFYTAMLSMGSQMLEFTAISPDSVLSLTSGR